MSRLALLLQDFHPTPSSADAAPGPRLPALERWLALASRAPAPMGWRGWLLGELLGAVDGGPGAGWAAAGLLPGAEGRHFWFATPVHYRAGLDTVHLDTAGLLALAPEEQDALVADFARVFGGSPWTLHGLGYRELLLEGPDPGPHTTADPATLLGRDLGGGQPGGAGVRPLRQLAAEVEMWLHGHAVNRAREARGALPLTGLWFWGGGRARNAVRIAPASSRLHGADLYSAGLGALASLAQRPVPTAAGALEQGGEPVIVVLPAACARGLEDLERLERDWFAPLLEAQQRGAWSTLTLVAGGASHTLRSAHRWRLWRRRRPWRGGVA